MSESHRQSASRDAIITPGQTQSRNLPDIVLVNPQLAENIGMVARAMANFGLEQLRLVDPRDGWPHERAMASSAGADWIINAATAHATQAEALQHAHWVCATTARQRDLRKPVLTPEQTSAELHRRLAAGQRCAIVFGRESCGLSGDELMDADALTMIPVSNRFASLNLAQAVLIIGYTFMMASDAHSLGRVTNNESPIETGMQLGRDVPATKQDLEGLFQHLEGELDGRGFFASSGQRPVTVRSLRSMLTRMAPTSKEVRMLRGIVATFSRLPKT
ncbi:MAG: RNA methyltransferase [Pseudomonadota bacterium]